MIKRICSAALALVLLGTAAAVADDKVDFVKQVQPLLVEHCGKCHGAEKGQGKLRLHTAEVIQERVASKPEMLVAGDPEKSLLYQRLVLPTDDKKRMPKMADPLPKEKIELIAKWIKEGALLPVAAATSKPAPTSEAKPNETKTKESAKPAAPPEVAAAPKVAIDKLTAAGAQVMPLYSGSNLLWVSFTHRDQPAGDDDLKLLADVAEQVDTLNLAGSKVTAKGMASLAALKNLSKLHLEKSSVTDEGLAHLAGLGRLQYLNVYGTGVSDEGLKQLNNLKQLRNLYLWQSKVSYDAAMALEAEIPGLSVDLGYDHPMVAKKRLTKALESAKAQADEAKAETAKLEKQLETAKKEAETTASRVADIEKELKALETKAEAKPNEKTEAASAAKDEAKK